MNELQELQNEVLKLDEGSRIELVHSVLEKCDFENSEHCQTAWDTEIMKRIEAIDTGKAQLAPVAEVFEELDRALGA